MLNVIVLWNTIYMDAALTQLRAEGYSVRDEDVARLSPLIHEHINMLVRPLLLCGTGTRGPWRTQAAAHSSGR